MKKLILPPKTTKYKKQQKGVLAPIQWKHRISFGVYGIQVLKSLRLTLKQLETTRLQISKHLGKSERFWFRVIPDIPVSKKPNLIRMGKGKGVVHFWVSRVKAGQTFVEFSFLPLKRMQKIFLMVSQKIPVPCVLLTNLKKIQNWIEIN